MGSHHAIERIVHKQILACPGDTPIIEAARRMVDTRCSSIIVVEDGNPVGIWTERDALATDFSDPSCFGGAIADVMSSPVKTIEGSASIGEAGMRFQVEGVRHFVVVDASGRPIGVISQSDVILNHGVEHFLVLRNVGSSMSRPLVTVAGDCPLGEAVAQLRAAHADAAVVIGPGDHEPGIITERDVVRLIAQGTASATPVWDVASRPLISVEEGDSLLNARQILDSRQIRHIGVKGEDGRLKGLLSFADILAALQYEYVQRLDEALRERDEALLQSRRDLYLARKVIEATVDAIMIVNPRKQIEFVNPAFTAITGYTADEAIGQSPGLLHSGRHGAEFYAAMWESLDRVGTWQGEVWDRRKNGDVFPVWLTINTISDDDGNVTQFAGVFADITERKKTEEKIKNLAYFDVLTGLPNRRLFTDRLLVAMANAHRHGARLAIMFLDLDLFKRINDSLGHGIGDMVLIESARRLSASVREGDTTARLGGDEFVVLLPEVARIEDVVHLAERIIGKVRQPFVVDDHELYVTTSIGIAVYPEDGTTVEDLIRNADTAMYRAKEVGRNAFQLYAAAMNAGSFERLAMESSLRHALEREELHLAYQVKVDLASGRMSGVEALVRWLHPEMGPISPIEFIPLAENMGLISEIGAWVMETACRQCKSWHELGLPKVRVAVNVSALQFHESDVPAVVRRALAVSGLEPCYLELELTESVLMKRVEEVAGILDDIRALGVRISIDDFGTGYSSLSYLKRIPIDALKIDRSFVRDITGNGEGDEIVSTIINLAHNLKLKAIAEGVETQAQADFLRSKGCDEIQGYLVSRPVSPEDLVSLFDRDLLPADP
ncbi:MAG: EAL domain-containing protein [Magnetospirillum sp.]|nr:EAL domain-containing protein [Magnetospirillum sp.]